MKVNDKVCAVTGALGGIGQSIVKNLLSKGAKFIAILDLDHPTNRNIYNALEKEFGDKVGCYPCDVTDKAQLSGNFDKIIAAHGVIDILINNAATPCEVNPELMIDINYKAVVVGTLMIIDRVGKHKGGSGGIVINVASIAGLVNFGCPIYCSTKHAVVSFTRNMDKQFDITGVCVMAVCPGATVTPFLDKFCTASNGLDFCKETYDGARDLFKLQSPDNVGVAVAKIIEVGKSGECWVSDEDQPPYLTRIEVNSHKDLRVE